MTGAEATVEGRGDERGERVLKGHPLGDGRGVVVASLQGLVQESRREMLQVKSLEPLSA